MTSAEPYESVDAETRRLRRQISEFQAAWPDGEVFRGEDASGAIEAEIDARGTVTAITLSDDWQSRVGLRSLARALNEATGAASRNLGNAWIDGLQTLDPGTVAPDDQPVHRRTSLAEYVARVPEDQQFASLRAKAELNAAAREEYKRFKAEIAQIPTREQFDSPRGFFTVSRSLGQLTGLEIDPNRIAFISNVELGRELVDVLAEIERRAVPNADDIRDRFPAIAQIREARLSG
jgi:hypothetical protein